MTKPTFSADACYTDPGYNRLVRAVPPAVPTRQMACAKPTRVGFRGKIRWFLAGLAVAAGSAIFVYRTGNETMELLGKGRDALAWAISGAEAARKREEHLLAALGSYRVQLHSQQIILERLDKLPICRTVIEGAPEVAPPRRSIRSDKRLPTERGPARKPSWFSQEELSRIFGSIP